MKQRGLVELARSGNLRRQIEDWGGGVEVKGENPVLVFDDGLGGFLPLSEADLSCEPLSLASAGIVPVPSSLMVMAEGVCVVKQTRRALYRHWQLAEGEAAPVRGLLARGARLVAEITLGRGEPAHLAALDNVALELTTQGLAAAWPLGSSLRYYREQWERHVRRESCPEGLCLERNAAPCHRTCPANIDIPSFMAHLGHGDYRSTIEVIRRDNPLPLTCGLVCPAPCESACVRGGSDGAVFIRPMKAKAAEHCLAEGGYPKPEMAPDTGKRIGIIGSGPASLTAAYYLRTLGHDVEIHEAQEHAGGMLRYGIPAYRCRLTSARRRSTRSGCWVCGSSPAPRSRASRSSARGTTPSSSASARRRLGCCRSKAPIIPSCSAASISCVPRAAANRCGLGRGWSSLAAATSPLTSR